MRIKTSSTARKALVVIDVGIATEENLKTDLDLRPIYHRKDENTMTHLNLGLLAYWLVNKIRHQLKQEGIHSGWRKIIRTMNTQKAVTTLRCPEIQIRTIRKTKICSTQIRTRKLPIH